jgi:hypothetical protein
MKKTTVGLFGTCGQSTWRKDFIEMFNEHNISFFNPQLGEGEWVADRADEFVQNENYHLKNDDIILFPVTSETTGQGSLAEIGFSVADTLRQIKGEAHLKERYLIVFIDPDCVDPKATSNQIEESKRSRKLVISKAIYEANINSRVFVVESLEEMKQLSLNISKHFINNSDDNVNNLYKIA